MSLIQCSNLTFRYDGSMEPLFENLNLSLDSEWKLGLIGRNGRGKTTFLQLLLGALPYRGSIHTSNLSFSYFPFPVEQTQDLAQSVVQQLCPDALDWELRRELSFLELPEAILSRPFCTLSPGEQSKLQLAALFLRDGHFLLIDEPTNHLDAHGRDLLSRYLNRKQGFIVISHDRSFLDGCVDHILSINKSGLSLQRGNASTWLENKARQDAFEQQQNERLNKDISRLHAAAKRSANWSDRVEESKYATKHAGLRPDRGYIGHKSAKMMQRAKNAEKRRQTAIEDASQLLQDVEQAPPLKLSTLPYPSQTLLRLRDVRVYYGDTPACAPVDLTLEQGERVALTGHNGSGKSSILKLIAGDILTYSGDFHKSSQLCISYVPQDSSFLRGSLRDFAQEAGIDETRFKTILRKLDFSRDHFTMDMSSYSDGQRKKVLIAKSLCEDVHLLLWDEPLNFVDLHSRMQIESLLLSYCPTLLFVEHDRSFCETIATKTLPLST